ncbi:MAG TPA: NmrA family NAD(P)-binding protein [Pseudonocardia sp.]|nr:NmrA family NAD(P)-binding protein [Pseudonocardia sp.]
MPPVLVTGATGNVGRPVTVALVAAGRQVRAAHRHPTDAAAVPGAEPVAFDFTAPRTWPAAFAGVETLLLVRPPEISAVRRDLLPALDAARTAGVRHVVFLSLAGADRIPVLPHATVEKWLRGSGLQWTFVRPSFFMQNLSTTHAGDIRAGTLNVPAGNGRTAFVDAHDVAAVAAAALLDPARHRGRAWTPTGPQALTYTEVADVLTDVLGRRVRYTRPGIRAYWRHARRELALPPGFAAVTAAIYTSARLGLAAGLTDDVRTVTGRAPGDLRAFVARERAVWLPPVGPGGETG